MRRPHLKALEVALIAALWGGWGCGRNARDVEAAHSAAGPAADNSANMHSVSVQFDYDFGKNPSCEEKPGVKSCVKQFDVYDVSGERFRLFSIPVPKGAAGMVKGISGKSPTREFLPGVHYLAVTAENAQGVESDSNVAKIRVEIKPNGSASVPPR